MHEKEARRYTQQANERMNEREQHAHTHVCMRCMYIEVYTQLLELLVRTHTHNLPFTYNGRKERRTHIPVWVIFSTGSQPIFGKFINVRSKIALKSREAKRTSLDSTKIDLVWSIQLKPYVTHTVTHTRNKHAHHICVHWMNAKPETTEKDESKWTNERTNERMNKEWCVYSCYSNPQWRRTAATTASALPANKIEKS